MTLENHAISGGGLTVTGTDTVRGAADEATKALADRVPARLLAKDATLWGKAAEAEASIRLGWVDLHRTSRGLVDELAVLRAELVTEGLDRVVLAGMGGSSLAPEVISRTLGVDLTILDTTDPHQVGAALADTDLLQRTVMVVSSKSGGTVETDSHRRAFLQAFGDLGLSEVEAGRRFVIVTDPGSPLVDVAAAMGARAVFLADPAVGGRYSALTAFGLVPAALAGINVAELLSQATDIAETLSGESPALALGVAMGAAARAGRDKLVLAEDGTGIVGLGDWAEQLLAESTGKEGRGILPVVIETPTAPGTDGEDVLLVTVGGSLRPGDVPGGGAKPDMTVNGPLGAHFLVWEFATAIAGRILEINPFDQPNVTESKDNTNRLLADGLPETSPAFTDGAIAVYGATEAASVREAVNALLDAIPPHGYLAVLAYLDRFGDAAAADVRAALAVRTRQPVTFGWGPRFLHSTGQYHKGGPQVGAFLQITGAVTSDLPVPGKPYTFGTLQAAQAAGDLQALAGRGRPVLRLHLTDRSEGIAQLLAALRVTTIDSHPANPLRDPADRRLPRVPEPCALVIFGVTGDLSRKKLIPAIYDLANRGLLPPSFFVLGFARRDWGDGEFEGVAKKFAREHARTPWQEDVWARLAQNFKFVPGSFDDDAGFDDLAKTLDALRETHGIAGNAAFYLSIPPTQFKTVLRQLERTKMADNSASGGWRRVVVEKPFGHDLESSRELNALVDEVFTPQDVFRIDHYLGKETVQNLLALRFANTLFEPVWSSHFVDSVQITMAEDGGIGTRAGFYNETGAARDVLQNHILQLLALTAMEEPVSFSADAIRAEKLKVLTAISIPKGEQALEAFAVRGQYEQGWLAGQRVPGYLQEEKVPADSTTETYTAVRLGVQTRRWAGVPFYLRTGKRLPRRVTEIAVVFKKAPHLPFSQTDTESLGNNQLVVRVQPDEGVTLKFGSKVPGSSMEVRDVAMDFLYGEAFTESSPEAYERLVLDVLLGDSTLFPHAEEVDASWRVIDPLEDYWAGRQPHKYRAGEWGPQAADDMLAREGRHWRRP